MRALDDERRDSAVDTPPRYARDAAATRQRLLAAAEVEFALHGFQGARLRAIAQRAAVQPALIHHYFGDKQGLYRMMLEGALRESSDRSWHILEGAQELPIVVERFVGLLLGFYRKYEHLLAILRREALATSPGSELTRNVLATLVVPVLDAVRAYVRQLQRAGEVRTDVEPDDILLLALSLCVFPFAERAFLEACWPSALLDDDDMLKRRTTAIVDAVMSYCRPLDADPRGATARRPRSRRPKS
jgi:AcrR family transcriptional regulator